MALSRLPVFHSCLSVFRRQLSDALVLDAITISILSWAFGLMYGVMRP